MSVKWCISEDWKTPATGEEWHESKDMEAAWMDLRERVKTLFKGKYTMGACWCHVNEVGTVADFGSHSYFGLIAKEGAKA